MKSGFAHMPKPQSVSATPAPRKTVHRKCACGGRVEIVGDPKDHSTTETIRSRLGRPRS